MTRYSPERKEAVLQKMMPPHNIPIPQLSEESGISEATLYNWRKQARKEGKPVPADGKNPEQWSSEDKFAIVLETSHLSEAELAEYCRSKGLYKEQISSWKQICMQANASAVDKAKQAREKAKQDKKTIRTLERELNRKEKALAETAALLVLRKKANAIWGDGGEE